MTGVFYWNLFQLIHNLMSVLLDAVQDWTIGGAIALSVLRAVTSIIEHGEVNKIN